MLENIKMYTSANNGEEILTFPIPPKDLPEIEDEWGHEEFITNDASMTLIGIRKRKKLTLELYLPVATKLRRYDREAVSGEKYIEFWQKWSKRRVPMRLVITRGGKTLLNIAYTIESLKWTWNKIQDIEAQISIAEYIFEEDLQEEEKEESYNWTEVRVCIRGRYLTVKGANINGNYIVPVREILETLGHKVVWNAEQKKIYYGEDYTSYTAEFEIYEGVSYSYVRKLCEAVGEGVRWDGEERVIYIG